MVVFSGTVISSIGVDFNNILVGEVDFVECTLDTIVNINIFKSKCHSLFFLFFFFLIVICLPLLFDKDL